MKIKKAALVVLCTAAICNTAMAHARGINSVTGALAAADGTPLSRATVRFYDVAKGTPFQGVYWRAPDYAAYIAANGTFSEKIPAGSYYVIAVNRLGFSEPPAEGTLVYPAWPGTHTPTAVEPGVETNLGTLKLVPFKKEWGAHGKTGVSGTVLDVDGKPVEGVLVLASPAGTKDGAEFIADTRTGKDGRYVVRVPGAGSYTVRGKGNSQIVATATLTAGSFSTGVDLRPPPFPGGAVTRHPGEGSAAMVCPSEDFETTVAGETGCLVMRKYGNTGPPAPKAMLVWLHGDLVMKTPPADYHFAIAEKVAGELVDDKVMSVALVRPGYPDGAGRYSSGNCYKRVDSYTSDNIKEVGAAIERLRARYKPEKVIIVGDSGGSAMAGVLLAMKPKIADGAVLVSCPCDLGSWRDGYDPWDHSENPLEWAAKTDTTAKIIALTGENDTNTVPALAKSYVKVLKGHGVDATFQLVEGASHGTVLQSPAVVDAIANLLR